MFRTILNAVLLINGLCVFVSACTTTQLGIHSQDKAILDQLREGGFVIYLVHAAADQDTKVTHVFSRSECEAIPNLTGLGKTQAKVIGKSIYKLKVPIGTVYSSQHCDCYNTAILAFGHATPSVDITLNHDINSHELQSRIQHLNAMLAADPDTGSNTILVGHAEMLKSAQRIELEEGEAAIFKPTGNGATELFSQVKANGWQVLVSNLNNSK